MNTFAPAMSIFSWAISPILLDDSTVLPAPLFFSNSIFWAATAPPRPAQALAPGETMAAPHPRYRALAFYSTTVEPDHVDFSRDAIRFYATLAAKENLPSTPLPTGITAIAH